MSSPSRPVTHLDKSAVLEALFESWDDIDRLLSGISDDDWDKPSPLPGWAVRDVVAHIIGTESMLLGVPTPEAGEVSGLAHVRNEIGAMNEAWVGAMRADSPAAMLERFRDITGQRKAVLGAMSEEDWDAVGFTPAGPDSYGRFMRIRIFDCWLHEHDIRAALSLPATDAELDSPAARFALDEVAGSMSFVVGKLGKAPDGARVALELTGPLGRTIRVAVDGRAALVDEFEGSPTTSIRLDGLQFTRLCGGRPLCPARSPEIEFDGDAEVGQRIVDRLNYVI